LYASKRVKLKKFAKPRLQELVFEKTLKKNQQFQRMQCLGHAKKLHAANTINDLISVNFLVNKNQNWRQQNNEQRMQILQ
jgi:hypothetical protein